MSRAKKRKQPKSPSHKSAGKRAAQQGRQGRDAGQAPSFWDHGGDAEELLALAARLNLNVDPKSPHLVELSRIEAMPHLTPQMGGKFMACVSRRLTTYTANLHGVARRRCVLLEDVAQLHADLVVPKGAPFAVSAGERDRWDRLRVIEHTGRRGPVTLHIGPTGSGKTYHALESLVERGAGVYAAPLRMIAQEAYMKLAERLGSERVGLLTGEERVNVDAPIICCTAELAPLRSKLLVLDEVHWADDADRGWAWTRQLVASSHDEMILISSADALPLLHAAVPEATIREFTRLMPLNYIGSVDVGRVESRTVVVAFSRKAVLSIASELVGAGLRVGALYGAMPPAARRDQIDKFSSGELDVMVATDVIGHGVNMPCDRVLFAETNKFDGISRRNLEGWEVAQIAGRAGRFGLSDRGEVGLLSGLPWLTPQRAVIERGLTPLATFDGYPVYRHVQSACLRPQLDELGVDNETPAVQLELLLNLWQQKARILLRDVPYLKVRQAETIAANLEAMRGELKSLPIHDAWGLAQAPVDRDDRELLPQLARSLRTGKGHGLEKLIELSEGDRLEAVEIVARRAALLRWYAHRFAGRAHITAKTAADAEAAASALIGGLLRERIGENDDGRCPHCDEPKAPWFNACDSCHQLGRQRVPAVAW